ncbi:MAG: hypothetical protein PHO29_14510 [Acetobacterium sp.]|nr:hypothetical protein [Acetobacterium sp.]
MEKLLKQIVDKLDNLETKIDKVDSNQLRMENEFTEKIRGLTDAQKVANEKLDQLFAFRDDTDKNMKFLITTLDHVANKIDDHTDRLERIEDKVTTHEIQIKVMDATKSNKRKAK